MKRNFNILIGFTFNLVSLTASAQAIDYDSMMDVASLRTGARCRSDAAAAAPLEAALKAFEKDYIKFSGGQAQFDFIKYYKEKLKGEDKLFAPYLALLPSAAHVYFKATAKHTIEMFSNRSKTKNILIGDSLMAMFRAYSEKHKLKADKKTYNAGIGGDTIDLLMVRARWNIEIFKPEKVVISISGNNVLSGCLIDQYNQLGEGIVEAVKNFTIRLRLSGVKQVFLINIPPVGYRYTYDSIVAYNARYGASLGDQIFVLDQYSAIVTPDGQKPAWSYAHVLDPIHLSDLAYQYVWKPVLDYVL